MQLYLCQPQFCASWGRVIRVAGPWLHLSACPPWHQSGPAHRTSPGYTHAIKEWVNRTTHTHFNWHALAEIRPAIAAWWSGWDEGKVTPLPSAWGNSSGLWTGFSCSPAGLGPAPSVSGQSNGNATLPHLIYAMIISKEPERSSFRNHQTWLIHIILQMKG